jgi:hypothetical protein
MGGKSSGGGKELFAGGFGDCDGFHHGKSWWNCGELRGKRGQREVAFVESESRTGS